MSRQRVALVLAVLIASGLAFGAGWAAASAQAGDPVEVAGDKYSVVLENDSVRVLRAVYPPGTSSAMHAHPDHVAVMLSDGAFRMVGPDGEAQEFQASAGEVLWAPAGEHAPESVGDGETEVILVEIKAH